MSQIDEIPPGSCDAIESTKISTSFGSLFVARSEALVTQIFRFMVAGAMATVGDTATLYCLADKVGLDYRIAAVFGFIIGSIISYSISVKWVFASRNISNRTLEFLAFVMIGVIGLGLTLLIMHVCVAFLHMHYMAGKAVAIVTVFGWNFAARRLLIFRQTGDEDNRH